MRRYPWGESAHSALRWAFGMLARVDVPPGELAHLRGPAGNPTDLTKLDRAAQAALIRLEVDRLDNPAAKAYLWAAYLPTPVLERQPGKKAREMVDRFPADRARNVHALAWWLMAQEGTGQHRIRGYQEIVAQYTCGEESLRRVKDLLKVGQETASQTRQRCYERLEELHTRSLLEMDDRLHRAGILEEEYSAGQQS